MAETATSPLPPASDSLPARPAPPTDEAKQSGTGAAVNDEAEASEAAAEEEGAAREAKAPISNGKAEGEPVEHKPAGEDKTDAGEDAAPEDKPKLPRSASKAASGASNGTPASSKKAKRKSTGGVPEHRAKKLNRKKSQALTHLDAQPGEYYFARLKGHAPWPAMICDEEMLPQALLASRPVTAKRADGTYREDVADGGKRAHERSFAVMFMDTHEFGWISNTDLSTLNLDTIGDEPEKGKSKALYRAYQVTAEKHDMAYYKNVLKDHQEAMRLDAELRASRGKKSKGKAKGKAAAEDDEDEDMADAGDEDVDAEEEEEEGDAAPKGKSKKRKKDVESDGEDGKPAKTPKRTGSVKKSSSTPKLKLSNPKTPNGTSASKSGSKGSGAKATKPRSASAKKGGKKDKVKAESDDDMADASPAAEEKPLTAAEQLEKKQKEILFLRHKLQKGFLTRDQPPKEEEMKAMSDYIAKLETYADLEVSIMRATKIHKVLKAIVKLASIPRDAEFKFKERCHELLKTWNRLLAASEGAGAGKDEKASNGVGKEDKSDEDKAEKADTPAKEDAKTDTTDGKESEPADKEAEPAKEDDEAADKEKDDKAESGDAPAEAK
ncbi:MAG: hypothetical protein M1832_001821 [Thelocarpon impressellum]|nr:MAG: hypothetical protein M1832_001821 [Thelocarpon impressellum]